MSARMRAVRRRISSRDGFAVAAVLYALGLVGVVSGVLFSSTLQTAKVSQNVSNAVIAKNDLQAASVTLAATAVLGAADNSVLCPPQAGNASVNCAAAPVTAAAIGSQAQLAANSSHAGSSGAPDEVGVFVAGAGVKQLDPWGHFYVYCRWENHLSPGSNPAFVIVSAGPDGKLDTACDDTAAKNDDLFIEVSVATAVNRSAVWQAQLDGSGNAISVHFGQTGSQLNVDAQGDLSVPGTLTVNGASAFSSTATAESFHGPLAGNVTGNVTGNLTGNVLGNLTGNVNGAIGNFTGAVSAGSLAVGSTAQMTVDTSGNIVTTGSLGAGATSVSALNVTNGATIGTSLTVNGAAVMNSGLDVQGGDLTLGNGNSYAETDSSGIPRRLIALDGSNDLLLGGRAGTQSLLFYSGGSQVGTLDPSGNLTVTGNISGAAGNFSNMTSGLLTLSGNLTGTNATFSGTVTAANITFTGNTTGQGASYGALTTTSITDSGTLAVTGASTLAGTTINGALTVSGVASLGLLSTASVTATGDIQTGNSGTSCTGSTAGAIRYASGSLTYCNGSAFVSASGVATAAAGSTGQLQFNNAGAFAASSALTWLNATGRLGVGTAAPLNRLDVAGAMAIGTGYAGITSAPVNGMIVQGNVGIGTTAPGATLDVAGSARFGTDTTACTSAILGRIHWNATTALYEYCNGSAWTPFRSKAAPGGSGYFVLSHGAFNGCLGNTAGSLTYSGTTAMMTAISSPYFAGHDLVTGQKVTVTGASPAAYNGNFTITVTSLTTFTYTMANNPGANATGTVAYCPDAGGLTLANRLCLQDLTSNTNWQGYAQANAQGLLTAAHVTAFLCDGTACQNPAANTTYYFASTYDTSAGFAAFTANASGQGPGDTIDWRQADHFGGINDYNSEYWTGRNTTSASLWATTSSTNTCSGWTTAASGNGEDGQTTAIFTSGGRWAAGTTNCSTGGASFSLNLMCMVNP